MGVGDNIEKYAKIAQNIAVIFGIIGGVGSLVVGQWDKKVSRSLEFYREYSSAIRKDFIELDFRWAQLASGHPNILEMKVEDQKQLVSSFFENTENQKLFINIINFYDTVLICIQNRACDRNTALDLFAPTARAVFERSAYYLEARRKAQRTSALGRGVEQIYKMQRELLLERYI